MKTKTKKRLALIAALFLMAGVLWFANAFLGNPVSWMLAKHAAEKYLAEQYAGTDYQLSGVNYSFKDAKYLAYVESPSSPDTHFGIMLTGWGTLVYDEFENYVTSGWNTWQRLDEEYRELVDSILDDPDLPYKITIGFGSICTQGEMGEEFQQSWLDMSTLELDGKYDIRETASRYGKLVVYIEDAETTEERAAELLLDLKKRMDAANVPFARVDFSLEAFRPEQGGTQISQDRVDLMMVPYEEICEEGLAEKVHIWEEKTEAFYKSMDAEKK